MDQRRTVLGQAYGDAAAFDRFWAEELREAGAGLIDGISLHEARRVLDLGAGIGLNVPAISAAAPNATIVAADFVEAMIRAASDDARRLVADAMALPFADGSFDAVVMAFMLFHVPSPQQALSEVRRVMAPGGRIAVGTWEPAPPFEPDTIWFGLLDEFGAAPLDQSVARQELMNSPAKLEALLRSQGFDDVTTDTRTLVDPMDLETFLTRRTTLGVALPRYLSLSPDARTDVVRRARAKLGALDPGAFDVADTAIYGWARLPS